MQELLEFAMSYVRVELLLLIPVLYFLGTGLKQSESVKDKNIPLILGIAGCVLSFLWILSTVNLESYKVFLGVLFSAITQGILTAGCSVYINQILKQSKKSAGATSVAPAPTDDNKGGGGNA